MARVTVEDCLEREENRFALVVLASVRARLSALAASELVVVSFPAQRRLRMPEDLNIRSASSPSLSARSSFSTTFSGK